MVTGDDIPNNRTVSLLRRLDDDLEMTTLDRPVEIAQ
jgi:hypothetical protein